MTTFQKLNDLNGKIAVITGASGQVGFATAKQLASIGCRIIGIVRSKVDEAKTKFQTLPNQELNHIVIEANITDTATIRNAVNIVQAEAGRVDILVNAAGISSSVKSPDLRGLTDELFDSVIINNLRGTFAVIREFIDLLVKTNDGLIVNIGSTSGQGASNSNIAYGAAKAGIDQMTRTLAKNLAPCVRVVSVVPGFMENATSGATKGPGANAKLAEGAPLKRIGYAEDIANTIEAMCTHIRFSTGSVILVEGGRGL